MKKITVVIVGNQYHDLMRFSIENTVKSTPDIEKIIVFGNKPVYSDSEFVQIDGVINKNIYDGFCLKDLNTYIKTDYVLIIQYDGMAVNADYWTDQFYQFDYIGAAWPRHFGILEQNRVGNGGFSLRSKKLLESLQDSLIQNNNNEDVVICQTHADYLRSAYNIKFAPIDLADRFSQEWNTTHGNTFGFHALLNLPVYFNDVVCENYINTIPIKNWTSDQLLEFTNRCEKKNYKLSLNTLNKKLTEYLSNR